MIYKDDNKTVNVEFEDADIWIHISAGTTVDTNIKEGTICFRNSKYIDEKEPLLKITEKDGYYLFPDNATKKEIADMWTKGNYKFKDGDYPVILRFRNIKSIDLVIDSLLKIKDGMSKYGIK